MIYFSYFVPTPDFVLYCDDNDYHPLMQDNFFEKEKNVIFKLFSKNN
ncbi:hypothetical protein BB14905_04693 [Bacillus sp. B14905]|nr:hypothetical protein BB14905_04693 [Bacillus sp. B14905]